MTQTDRLAGPRVGISSSRLPVLDGLRSWVILVMLAHFGNFDYPPPGDWIHRGFLMMAQVAFVGLDVFFILSGFLITRILLDTKGSASYFRTFYARRTLRIFPLYYGFLIVYFFILPRIVSWDASAFRITPLQHFLYWTYLQNNWIALERLWDPIPEGSFLRATFHFWSLAVEEQFYLLWPAVVYFCGSTSLKRVCLGCMIAAPVIRIALVVNLGGSTGTPYFLTPARLDGLALGALMAIAAREPGGLAVFLRWAKPVAPIAAGLLLTLFLSEDEFRPENALVQAFGVTASVYLAGALVAMSLVARENGVWHRTLNNWPMRKVGQYSYAIYVLHLPLAYVLDRSGLVARSWFHERIVSQLGAELGYSVTLILLSICAGALSWHLYEKPILSLRRYLPYATGQAQSMKT